MQIHHKHDFRRFTQYLGWAAGTDSEWDRLPAGRAGPIPDNS